eukprot:gnl/TRDRNA2_/TRDRNA2_95541_c0_seq1.p1 gnl/TRDRNA2_/TRDRNA2_95541_c0~~gnl/TRDRNA2_/TRDRNA2_95541_c0_seq1.p1  ORF type:complete len:536 (-),score=65.90 gnl/TRDRNA2_/TRDRNA2_95541_c0_seq1:380-1963(-)
MSPIHDHAGSSCWVKVLQGQLREVRYEYCKTEVPNRKMKVLADQTFEQEAVAYINDTRGVHAMGNPNPNQVCVSLHVYAPPYVLCKVFDENTSSTREASMSAAIMPSNPTSDKVNTVAMEDVASEPAAKRPRTEIIPQPSNALCGHGDALNLSQLQAELKRSVRADGTIEQATELLSRLVFAESEWCEFVHFEPFRYTRSLVALDSSFSLMVLCWNKGHATPLHSHPHGIRSWAKVLRGSLALKRFADATASDEALLSEHRFQEGECLDESEYGGLHIVSNPSSTTTTVSLHLYSPPYVDMAYVDPTGRQRSIPVVYSATSACGCGNHSATAPSPDGKHQHATDGGEEGHGSIMEKLQLATFGSIYTDIHGFISYWRRELNPDDVAGTLKMLEGFHLQSSEWLQYVAVPSGLTSSQMRANKIAQGDSLGDRIEISTWPPGADGDLSSLCSGRLWFKVLQGELEECEHGTGSTAKVVVRRSRLSVGSVVFYDIEAGSRSVALRNAGKTPAYGLHLVADSAVASASGVC